MNDLFIVSQIKQGELKVFDTLYPRYRDEFCHWIGKQSGLDEETCKDVYQQSIVILFENIRDGKLKELTSSLKTYIFSIGRNKAREHRLYQVRYGSTSSIVPDTSNENDIDHETREEQFETIEKSLNALVDPCKGILMDFYYYKKSIKEITERFGYKNTDSTKNQKSKCMKKLRSLVKDKIKAA